MVYYKTPYRLFANVGVDRSHKYGLDVVDSIAERQLNYPVQSSDSTDVKQMQFTQAENETSSRSLDSGFSRCDNFIVLFRIKLIVTIRFVVYNVTTAVDNNNNNNNNNNKMAP